jgi:hypothetical protein
MREEESCELYDIFTDVFSKNISDMIKARYLAKVRQHCLLQASRGSVH